MGFESQQGIGIFLFTTTSRHALQWVPGAFSLGVKRPGSEADHSCPLSVEVKSAWSLSKHRTCLIHKTKTKTKRNRNGGTFRFEGVKRNCQELLHQ